MFVFRGKTESLIGLSCQQLSMLIRILAGERWTLKNIIFIDYSLSETSQVISQTVYIYIYIYIYGKESNQEHFKRIKSLKTKSLHSYLLFDEVILF